jgi:hypothetical protein
MCGEDEYTKKRFERRKPRVEARILELGEIFACGIYSWAVMSKWPNRNQFVETFSASRGRLRTANYRTALQWQCGIKGPGFAGAD